MNDPGSVRGCQCRSYLDADVDDFVNRQSRLGQTLSKCLALNKLCGYEMEGTSLANLMNGEQVGMIKGRRGGGFTTKAKHTSFIIRQSGWEQFQGDSSSQSCVFGQINFAH